MPVALRELTEIEVGLVWKQLKNNRASGPDEMPAEIWKAVGQKQTGLAWGTEMVNRCWREECMPDE